MRNPAEFTPIRNRGLRRVRAADYVGVSPRTFDAVAAREGIKAIRIPGHRRSIYDIDDLDRVIDKWKTSGGNPEAA